MTWTETHERTRIIREVEAAAAVDMSGALPWREEWSQYFAGPEGLVAALRSRWARMCEAQLDVRDGEDQFADTYARLRRAEAGVLAIFHRVDHEADHHVTLTTAPTQVPEPARARRFHFHGGPVLPAS